MYRRGARRPGALPLAEAGAAARGADGFVWIGLRQPTPDEVAEVAVFVGPHFVVTVRHGDSDVLRQVRTELDTGAGDLPARGPLGVLYRAADPVVDQYEHAVEGITEDVDEIESQVFGGSDEDHSERIYKLKREVAEFRRAAMPLAIR